MPAPIIPRPLHPGADPCGVRYQLACRGGRPIGIARAVRVGRVLVPVPLRRDGREIGAGQAGYLLKKPGQQGRCARMPPA